MPASLKGVDGDFLRFCRMQLESKDNDCHLPFLTAVADDQRLTTPERAWLVLLFMAYYSEGSGWACWTTAGVRTRKRKPPDGLPIQKNRRNLYGGRINKHLDALYLLPPMSRWLSQAHDWTSLLSLVGGVWGNGRWACYTTAETLSVVCRLGLEPTTYEIVKSSGPKRGLLSLGLPVTEESCERVRHRLEDKLGASLTMGQVESFLCDWAGVCRGTFYAGRNIDRLQGRILAAEAAVGRRFDLLWQVRASVFPSYTLGELNGWRGIDKPRLRLYKKTGRLPATNEERG